MLDILFKNNDWMRQRDDLIRQRDGLLTERPEDTIPSMLLNTLPKSASVFILETLAKTLGKPTIQVSPGYFPRDQIDFRQFRKLIDAKAISQSHLDASDFNQKYLRKIDKVIVQYRDPRQATLSWLHHLERLYSEKQDDLIFTVNPVLPENYFTYELPKKIDYQLEYYLPQVINWQLEWINFIDSARDSHRFMLNTYEAFVENPGKYFSSILYFLGCTTPGEIQVHEVTPTTEKNFRKGLTNEWQAVFSDAQILKATQMIPTGFIERFGWAK
jgi:hypothetical protein